MLTLGKNRITVILSHRRIMMGAFMAAVVLGFGVPYAGFGAGAQASATSSNGVVAADQSPAAVTTLAGAQAVTGSTASAATYVYRQISVAQAYPYYIAASFITAGGLSLYALTYVPSRAERRSRYASRLQTWARTTY